MAMYVPIRLRQTFKNTPAFKIRYGIKITSIDLVFQSFFTLWYCKSRCLNEFGKGHYLSLFVKLNATQVTLRYNITPSACFEMSVHVS